ncbi:EGFR adapter protein [Zeugodacus cucurbitae]|uniref:EGFR adapter protein n=1 Tax=Zeugodacus cucurbitae TaxID=28588 RepID=UPI000596972F|nr:EGFR adapter protein [Zeugodacus cucurbitae]
MINNNLDYERNSNTTPAGVDGVVAPTATTTTTPSATISPTTANSNNRNSNSNSNSNHASVDNGSYFNRFDNRIAANLAAVLTGSRFRSSSSSTSSPTKTLQKTKNANNLRTAQGFSNSSTNMHTVGSAATPPYNGVSTLGGGRKPPAHLQLHNGGSNSRPSSPQLNGGSVGRNRRPLHLFTQANLNCNDNEKAVHTPPSSDEDNSPTELNNCKRLVDKPPLVKRLTMGLLRSNEESRPLVSIGTPTCTTNTNTLHSSTSNKIYSNGYINEEAFEPEKFIASKFGDSCRQSLTAIPMLDTVNLNDNSEFNLKKRYLRETSSANSSPKIFANRLRNNTLSAALRSNTTSNSTTNTTTTADALDESEEADLKDASWFQAGISRDIAVEVLSSKSPGAFLVRKSTSKPGCFALTLRVPSPPGPKTANYIILRTARGYKIKGFRKEFSTLQALITHHSVMPELLPVPLAMPRPTNMTSSRRNIDDFDTYDSLQMLVKYLRAKTLENE